MECGTGDAAVIKSHHNVGGLPDDVGFRGVIEPLRSLLRTRFASWGAARAAEALVMRQPFPGPGLAIRIIGDVTEEKLVLPA